MKSISLSIMLPKKLVQSWWKDCLTYREVWTPTYLDGIGQLKGSSAHDEEGSYPGDFSVNPGISSSYMINSIIFVL
jgi:hypothetical protein